MNMQILHTCSSDEYFRKSDACLVCACRWKIHGCGQCGCPLLIFNQASVTASFSISHDASTSYELQYVVYLPSYCSVRHLPGRNRAEPNSWHKWITMTQHASNIRYDHASKRKNACYHILFMNMYRELGRNTDFHHEASEQWGDTCWEIENWQATTSMMARVEIKRRGGARPAFIWSMGFICTRITQKPRVVSFWRVEKLY